MRKQNKQLISVFHNMLFCSCRQKTRYPIDVMLLYKREQGTQSGMKTPIRIHCMTMIECSCSVSTNTSRVLVFPELFFKAASC